MHIINHFFTSTGHFGFSISAIGTDSALRATEYAAHAVHVIYGN